MDQKKGTDSDEPKPKKEKVATEKKVMGKTGPHNSDRRRFQDKRNKASFILDG